MTTLIRWSRFNLIGVAGMAVQLSTLSLLCRAMPGHYLVATVAAVELTLLHNFYWHRRFTWKDRQIHSMILYQFLRFNLLNGSVSLLGNLLLMRVFVHRLQLPVVFANAIAVLTCSLVNFGLAHKWAFASRREYDAVLLQRGRVPGGQA